MEKLTLTIKSQPSHLKIQMSWSPKFIAPIQADVPADLISNIGKLSTPETDLRDVGYRLFTSIFRDRFGEVYHQILAAAEQNSDGLAVYLDLDEPTAQQPWELMYDPQKTNFLILDPFQTMVRVVEQASQVVSTRKKKLLGLPLRLLHIVASPSDSHLTPINASTFPDSLRYLRDRGLVLVDQISGRDTFRCLNDKMLEVAKGGKNQPYSIVHIEAHGDVKDGIGYVYFCDAENDSVPVAADELAQQLAEFPDLRIAVLNCCRSGEVVSKFRYGSLARALVASGIPVVIGMNGLINDDDAHDFMRAFLEQIIILQKPIGLAVSQARNKVYRHNHLRSPFYVPSLYAPRDSDGVLGFAFDPAQITTREFGLSARQYVEVIKPVKDIGEVEVSVLSVSLQDNHLQIEIQAFLRSEGGEQQIKLGHPQLIVEGVKLPAITIDQLELSKSRSLHTRLSFMGAIPSDANKAALVFNEYLTDQSNQSPYLIVKDIPLPPGNKSTTINTYANSRRLSANLELKNLIETCATRQALVTFCLSTKGNWEKVEHWLVTDLLELWALEYLIDAELADYIRQAIHLSPEVHRALWSILRHLDPSLIAPAIYVHTGTGRKEQRVDFEKLLPGKSAIATIRVYQDKPLCYLSGNITSNREWLLINGNDFYKFKHHPENGPLDVVLSVSIWKLLFSSSSNPLLTSNAEIIIQVDPEYQGRNASDKIMVPVTVRNEPVTFLLALYTPSGLAILAFLLLFGMFFEFAAWVNCGLVLAIFIFILLLIYLIFQKIIVRLIDDLQ